MNTVPLQKRQIQQCKHTLKQFFQDGVNRELKATVPDLLRKYVLELENSTTAYLAGWHHPKQIKMDQQTLQRRMPIIFKAHFFCFMGQVRGLHSFLVTRGL